MGGARKPTGKVTILPPEGAAARPHRWRSDGWSPRKRQQFLEVLRREASITEAARAVGLSKTSVTRLRDKDAEFDRECEDALSAVRPSLVETAYQRAVLGVEEPVFQAGKLVGTKRKYSDAMLRLLIDRGIDPSTGAAPFDPTTVTRPGYASEAEVTAALMQRLDELARSLERGEAGIEALEMEQFALAWHGGGWGDREG